MNKISSLPSLTGKTMCVIFWLLLLGVDSSKGQNLLDMQSWVVGTGSTGSFIGNGFDVENVREWGTAPNGERAVVWKAVPSGDGQPDGGWNHRVTIDHRKRYRFTVWLKKTNSADGYSYFGCENVSNLNGQVDTNPYFWHGDLPELDKWFLLVAFVHGSDDNSTIHEGGIYDGITGVKRLGIIDFKFLPNTQTTLHRSYLYYDPNVNDRQYFYGPRLEVVDGTEAPLSTLLVNGAMRNATNGSDGSVRISHDGALHLSGNDPNHIVAYRRHHGTELIDSPVMLGWSGGALGFKKEAVEHISLFWNDYGNVGIGTLVPKEKLSVNGKIRAHEIKVETANWPDYVFKPDYNLNTLSEVERFIQSNGHLPEIPSAMQVEDEGLSIGEMNKLLIKKVEELTLHAIENEKKRKKLEGKLNEMEILLNQLKAK